MRDALCICAMRTTIDIAEDVLAAARQLSRDERKTMGEVLTELSRAGLEKRRQGFAIRNGMPVIPSRSNVVITLELVNALRDQDP